MIKRMEGKQVHQELKEEEEEEVKNKEKVDVRKRR